ncbi:hypothetical protein Hanom_Chr11g00972931 [Helianthus anomalus]
MNNLIIRDNSARLIQGSFETPIPYWKQKSLGTRFPLHPLRHLTEVESSHPNL